MKIALDIGGVISKFPDQFRELVDTLIAGRHEVFVITDMHDRNEVLNTLAENGFQSIPAENVYTADYNSHGEFCKAILLKQLKIDMFVDDFGGYVQWDSRLGPAPIRLLVAPDGFKPYWHASWQCSGGSFGRRVCVEENLK